MTHARALLVPGVLALTWSPESLAYVGPSLGLGVIGTVIAVIAITGLSLFAFVVTPIRRYLKKRKAAVETDKPDSSDPLP